MSCGRCEYYYLLSKCYTTQMAHIYATPKTIWTAVHYHSNGMHIYFDILYSNLCSMQWYRCNAVEQQHFYRIITVESIKTITHNIAWLSSTCAASASSSSSKIDKYIYPSVKSIEQFRVKVLREKFILWHKNFQ